MQPIVFSLAIALGLTLAPLAASANLPAPMGYCSWAGDACNVPPDGQAGVCAQQKCSRPTPNGTTQYDCLKCVPKKSGDPKDKPKK